MSEGLIHHDWLEAEAEVKVCKYRQPRGWDRSGGARLGSYTVSFTYMVDGVVYWGGTPSPVEVQVGDKFAVRYNPERPEENNSLASECEGPWLNDYTYLLGIVVLGAMVYGLLSKYLLHR